MKRAMLAKGWVASSGHANHMFNVKWEYSDANQDIYTNISNNQFYNHFPDTRELTTK